MKLSVLALTVAVVAVLGAPVENTKRGNEQLCPAGLFSIPKCCATDVLGLADLDCQDLSSAPSTPKAFTDTCAKAGQRARCCVLPVLGQALLCTSPLGQA